MPEQSDVYVIGGDAGSLLDVIPAVAILKESGFTATWFADSGLQAQAGRILDRYGIPYEVRGPDVADNPRIILVACSTKAIDAQMVWTRWARQRRAMGGSVISVIWHDDLFVNSVRGNVMTGLPDVVLCISDHAARMVKSRRPNVETIVVGKWGSDGIAGEERVREKRAAIRAQYGLEESDFLVTLGFAGEPAERAVAQVEAILRDRVALPRDAVYAFRFHPAHPQREELWERIAASDLPIIDARKENLFDLYLGSRAVITDYVGTDAYRLTKAGVPNGTMLFPDDTEYRKELGYPDGVPPILLADENFGMHSVGEIAEFLARVSEALESMAEYTRTVRTLPFRQMFELDAPKLITGAVMNYLS